MIFGLARDGGVTEILIVVSTLRRMDGIKFSI